MASYILDSLDQIPSTPVFMIFQSLKDSALFSAFVVVVTGEKIGFLSAVWESVCRASLGILASVHFRGVIINDQREASVDDSSIPYNHAC